MIHYASHACTNKKRKPLTEKVRSLDRSFYVPEIDSLNRIENEENSWVPSAIWLSIKVPKIHPGGKRASSANCAGKIGFPHVEK